MSASRPPGRLEDILAVAALAALVVITFVNVVVRYLTDQSIAWTEEISSALMFVMALLATSAAVARDRHIRIEALIESGPLARRRRLALLSALTVALVFVIFGVLGARMTWDELRFEETSPAIGIPKWWYSVWLPILSFAVAFRALGLVRRIRSGEALAHDGEPPIPR